MLRTLTVTNFALIEQAGVEFSEGLNILTGETGAGKSILIDALNTILGSRASAEYIRGGSDFFRVEAVFDQPENQALIDLLADQGIEVEDGTLIISRVLSRQGKNTVLVNGCHVTLGFLRKIGGLLVDMHGQHENQALLKQETHLALLDGFSPEIKTKQKIYADVYKAWKNIAVDLDKIHTDSRERAQRLDMLQWQIEEIGAAALKDGEEESLDQEIRILANGEKLINSTGRAYTLLKSDAKGAAVLSVMAEIKKELENVCRYDNTLQSSLSTVTETLYQLEDVAAQLRIYRDNLDFDPQKLAQLQERQDIIHKLQKKYGATIADIFIYYEQAVTELASINNYEERLRQLEAQKEILGQKLAKMAAELTVLRQQTADIAAGKICGHLAELGMPKARMVFQIKAAANFTETGIDELALMFSANQGEELKPLQKIASGGELSRIALAIKAVGVSRENAVTMVFDEVDAGVGGQTAQMVAEKIALVSRNKQVLCITHLPQIAAMADRHIYVEKDISGERTRTVINILSEAERCVEISRMTSGDNLTEAARSNAAEMITSANDKKRNMVI